MDCIDLAQDRNRLRALVNVVMNLRVPQNAGDFLTTSGHVSFSSRILLSGAIIIVIIIIIVVITDGNIGLIW